MVSHKKQHGHILLEIVIAGIVLTTVLSAAFTGRHNELTQIGQAFRETKAEALLTEATEELLDPHTKIEVGRSELVPLHAEEEGLLKARIVRDIHALEPGLYAARLEISWHEPGAQRPRISSLETWIARKDG